LEATTICYPSFTLLDIFLIFFLIIPVLIILSVFLTFISPVLILY